MHPPSDQPQTGSQPRTSQRGFWLDRLGVVVSPGWIGGVFGIAILLPTCVVAVAMVSGVAEHGAGDAALSTSRWGSLARTLAYASGIGLLSTLLALPAAALVARLRPGWLVALATPMLLPSFLTYAGWSIARAPTTLVGRWIAGAPERGLEWLPLVVSRGLAVWGLSLWAWPLAGVVIVLGFRATASQLDDALRLDCVRASQRWRARLASVWPSVLTAWGLVTLLMLGSAVPLHVARVQTFAIRVWTTLDTHPGEPWRAWLAAWPLALIAAIAGWVISGRFARAGRRMAALAEPTEEAAHSGSRPGVVLRVAAALPWVLAVVVPLGLFWSTMGSPRMLGVFLERAGEGVATSLVVGAAVGAIASLTCLAVAHAASDAGSNGLRGFVLRALLAACLAWALLPGVLVGAAIASMMRLPMVPDAIGESAIPMVVAHVSRVLFLPVLIGLWLASSEARSIGESRRLDGATGPIAWGRTALGSVLGPSLAVGLASLCLSVHEIESSLQVQSPGIDHLAQRLLQWLHYERTAELSAAGVLLLGLGVVGSVLAILLTRRPGLRTRTGRWR
ncbi:MAG: hypothetical protein Q9O74_02895 [Planctomycetota bacterium]|nr:hypothetical protein [Planctomycetota bacterium]